MAGGIKACRIQSACRCAQRAATTRYLPRRCEARLGNAEGGTMKPHILREQQKSIKRNVPSAFRNASPGFDGDRANPQPAQTSLKPQRTKLFCQFLSRPVDQNDAGIPTMSKRVGAPQQDPQMPDPGRCSRSRDRLCTARRRRGVNNQQSRKQYPRLRFYTGRCCL